MSLKSLSRLLKISQQRVEEKRLALRALQSHHQAYQAQIKTLKDQRHAEQEKASLEVTSTFSLEAYLKAIHRKIEALEKEIHLITPSIQEAQKALREEYREMKTLDSVLTNQLRLLKEAREKKEQAILDEIAQTQFTFLKRPK